jgi:hypothetical protein
MRLLDPLASRTLEKSRLGSRKSQDDSLAARSFRSRVMALPVSILISIPLLVVLLVAPAGATPQELRHQIEASPATTPPLIDGVVGDQEWAGATVADQFIQYQPQIGELSAHRTEVLVLYDEGHLYFAFLAWDDEDPTAQLTRRDSDLSNDDAAIIVLDSHHDRQSAYVFGANLLDTQTDGRIANDGRTVDLNWDGAWQSAASRTDFGWSIEIAIPFTSIKYRAGEEVSWGLNLGRTRPRTLETAFWSGPLDNEYRVSQAGTLNGLTVAGPARRHQIIPYGLARLQDDEDTYWSAGIDGRYEVTPEMSAFGTLNPDFALIEADQERVNLTRFEVFLPEKRQFFMEGDELFRQRIRTFYSRRIEDVFGGARVLGRAGAWTVNGLYSRAEPFESESEDPLAADYGVLRLQRDIGTSNVGFIAANRTLNGVSYGSAGLDTTLFFTPTFGMTAQVVESYGLHDDGSLGLFVRPSYDSPTGHFHVRYTDLGEHFAENVNAVGFIRDDDRRELDSALEKKFWPQAGHFEQIEYSSNYNVYWSQKGDLRSWQIDQGVEVQMRNRWAFEVDFEEEYIVFEREFQNRQLGFEVGYNTREFESVAVTYRIGRNFDSDFQLVGIEASKKITDQLSIQYELEWLTLDPDPENESTWIHVIRATQFFTPDLFLNVFFQTNTSIDRNNLQAVFVYRYQPPFGTIQVAYQRGTAGFGERSDQGNTLFLKATTVF